MKYVSGACKSGFLKSIAVASIVFAAPMSNVVAGVTDADIANDAKTTGDVVTHGMGLQGQRWSPLNKINSKNIGKLVPAYTFSFGGEKMRGQEAQPLVHDGVIYVTASYNRVFALDAITGKQKWQYDHRLPEGILPCCDVINRGGALYGDLFIFATLDALLVALNTGTGEVVWKQSLGDFKAGHSATAAPIVVEGKVITGVAGGEFGIVGKIRAFDAKTGKLVWERPTIEGHIGTLNGKPNGMTGKLNATWPGDLWKVGGGAPWNNGTYDAETRTILWGTGNPAPWNSHMRPGDNLYAISTLALDPDTGKIKWHFQYTPNEAWDYDGTNHTIPFNKGGKKYAAHADRNGFFYVLDRTNGKLVNAFPFVDGHSWASSIDLKTGRPIEAGKRPGDPTKSADGKKGTVVTVSPSFLGGTNFFGMAYSQNTGLFYVPTNEMGMDIWNEPITYKKGAAYMGAGFSIKPLNDDYIGAMRAFDPMTGKKVWEVKNGAPLWAGAMATAGNLVFYGTPEGFFKAVDAKSGKELWQYQTGSGIVGSPITWEQDGVQYITVPSGWGAAVPLWGGEVAKQIEGIAQGASLVTFKLLK
ncbi:MAG: PQQ-dependent dehydrogenase, methanol/ethanol family [Gammaproteobacteria bacterium]|nr:MAG: PQQ-dependent dehydrogenase, methanol/ethanol family [Gammaproteobacteria bacterium]